MRSADNRYRVTVGMVNPTAVASRFWVQMFDTTNNDASFVGGVELLRPDERRLAGSGGPASR